MMDLIYDGSMDSRLFKDILGKTIKELSEQDSDFIYLDADLMSCIGTCGWAAEHPERGRRHERGGHGERRPGIHQHCLRPCELGQRRWDRLHQPAPDRPNPGAERDRPRRARPARRGAGGDLPRA